MNYYERHLGDYARDTGHLSLLEHGAYTLLLDRYYATEEGIPAAQAYRVARARTAPEREAVDAVLSEFFTLTDGVWQQRRVQEVIAEFQEGDEDRAAKRENAKERQRRARARRAELFAALRAVGIVPAWDTHTTELERLLSRATSQPVTPPVTRDDTATHTQYPIPNTKQEKKQEHVPPAAARSRFDEFWAVYPNKKARKAAQAVWLRRKLDARCDELIAHVNAMREMDDGWQRGFVPLGTTYLNGDRWEDVPARPPDQPARMAAPASKTLTAIQTLQGMKSGHMDSRHDSGRTEPAALLGHGSDPGG